jgi:hypothetical protein
MLEEELDAGDAALGETVGEGAGRHHVAGEILAIEDARVALEAAVGIDTLQVERGELHLVRARAFAHA